MIGKGEQPRAGPSPADDAQQPAPSRIEVVVTNPYLAPVTPRWSRAAGLVLLAVAVGLTTVLGLQFFDFVTDARLRRAMTSSSLVFALILLVLCGMCWQAGYRLAFNRPDRTGTLFSRLAWIAIGTGLLVVTTLMGAMIVAVRRPTLLDVQVMLFLGGIGVWCLVLASGRRNP